MSLVGGSSGGKHTGGRSNAAEQGARGVFVFHGLKFWLNTRDIFLGVVATGERKFFLYGGSGRDQRGRLRSAHLSSQFFFVCM
jgi:hypothetical protein